MGDFLVSKKFFSKKRSVQDIFPLLSALLGIFFPSHFYAGFFSFLKKGQSRFF